MIRLIIYGHKSDGGQIEYECKNLLFQDFYVGRKRDEPNLRIVRKFSEGAILLQDEDFDTLKNYFFSQQDAQIRINGTWHWCIIDFIDPNYLTEKAILNLTFVDQYSLPLEGIIPNGWYEEFYEPLFPKKISVQEIKDHCGSLSSYYVDGSQYRYDPSSENLWYRQYFSINADKNVTTSQIFRWNTGGDGVEIEDLTFSSLYAKNNFYKPYSIHYSNPIGSTYRSIYITYIREVRYFPEGEEVPEEWNDMNSSKVINNIIYWMHARFYGGEKQTYFSGNQVYNIKDEHLTSGYMLVSYNGYYSELQDSPNFVKLNELLKKLTCKVFNVNFELDSDVSNHLYISTLKSYNDFLNYESFEDVNFALSGIVDYLRDQHAIYLSVENIISFKTLNFSEKLLDIDNFKNKNWHENNAVNLSDNANIYEFISRSKKLDFKNVSVNFFGTKKIKEDVSSSVITDCEIFDKSYDEYILIDTNYISKNQIQKPFRYIGETPEYDGVYVKRGEDGSFVKWAVSGTLELYSNNIYVHTGGYISYSVKVDYGVVKVQIGSYSGYHSSSGTHSANFTGDGKKNVKLTIMGGGGNAIGEISLLRVSTATLVPTTKMGLISGIKQKNASLSLPQNIIDNKPLMSYPRGSMENIGIIDCNTKYSKEISFTIPLDEEIFELDFDKYMSLNGEKWIVFERKRQILTNQDGTSVISKYDKIKCKSNEIS